MRIVAAVPVAVLIISGSVRAEGPPPSTYQEQDTVCEEEESTGEAADASTAGEACRAYCVTSYATACWRVTALCSGVTVITIGGASVPCSTIIPAVCLGGVALGSICRERCPA